MLAIPRQAQWVKGMLLLTVAWQTFVYGWVAYTAGQEVSRVTVAPSIRQAWTQKALPPIRTLIAQSFYRWASYRMNIEFTRARLQALASIAFHVLWILMALRMAGPSTEVGSLWGYMLTAWNPLAMYAVVIHRWDFLLAQAVLAWVVGTWMRRRTWRGVGGFWLAVAVDLRTLLFWPLLVWQIRRLNGWIPRLLALTPGIGLGIWVLERAGWAGFVQGIHTAWWGTSVMPDVGWNALTFLSVAPVSASTIGWISLALWSAATTGLLWVYARETMTFRTFTAGLALAGWLLFWQARFLEMGLALYWIAVRVASGIRWHRDPLCGTAEEVDFP